MIVMASIIVGLLTAASLIAIVLGVRGTTETAVARRATVNWRQTALALSAGVLAIAAWVATGWPVAAIGAVALVVLAPRAVVLARRQRQEQAMLDATRMWLLQLRTSLRAGVGLETALRETASQISTDSPLWMPLQRMLATLDVAGPDAALALLAREMDNHVGDTAMTLLSSALHHSQRGVSDALAALGEWADQDLSHMRQVAAEARGLRLTRQMVTAIFVVLAVYLRVTSPELMAPYETLTGQFVLLAIGGVAAAAVYLLQRWSSVQRADRFFRDEVAR